MIITAHHNPRLKRVRTLIARRRERLRTGLFVAEGEDLVAAAVAAGWPAEELFVAAATSEDGGLVDADPGDPAHPSAGPVGLDLTGATLVAPALLASVSSLGSGARVIGIYRQRFLDAPVGPRCLHLHGLRDPGNVGTAIRAAHALDASCVSLGPGTVDPYSPKAVRASMGSVFSLPLARASGPEELPGTTVALVAREGTPLRGQDVGEDGVSLLIGSERTGLSDETIAACDRTAHLPIDGAESLNAAMAATVALYELGRHA